MGLDTSHDAWHGAYSSFNTWRTKIAEIAGFPPLELMQGFYSDNGEYPSIWVLIDYKYPLGNEIDMASIRRLRERLPIKWDLFEKHPLIELLTHSDCEGHINYGACGKIATELERLLQSLEEDEITKFPYKERTKQFIEGCKLAHKNKEKLEFH